MQTIRVWLADHPDEAESTLWHNRSFIFFREAEVEDLDAWSGRGRKGAARTRPLPGCRSNHPYIRRSLFHPSDSLTHIDGGKPFRRLMLALDTGSAIVGPARGDIFTGSGDEAGRLAGIGAQSRHDFRLDCQRRPRQDTVMAEGKEALQRRPHPLGQGGALDTPASRPDGGSAGISRNRSSRRRSPPR